MEKFDEKMPSEFDYCEDSTSSITIKKKITKQSKIEFSYDIIIMDLYEDASYILRKNGSGQYVWNQLPDFTSFEDDYRQIAGADMWEDLRQCYYDKKIAKVIYGGFRDIDTERILRPARIACYKYQLIIE